MTVNVENVRKYLTPSELALALTAAQIRDELIIRLLYETGCELQELVKIKIKHISNKTIILGSKSKKRKLSISLTTHKLINEFLKNHPYKQKSTFLFYSRESHVITTRRIEQLLKVLGNKLDLKINPRIIRATSILNDLQNRVPVDIIQKKTGLNSLNNYLYLFLKGGWYL